MLSSRLDHVTDNVSQKTLAIAETLMRRTDEISTNLTRSTESLTASHRSAQELTEPCETGSRLSRETSPPAPTR